MRIELTRGAWTQVSAQDYAYLSRWSWHLSSNGYAIRITRGGRRIAMHQVIVGVGPNRVDHRNRDRLDNRRSNLRKCKPHQNCSNRKQPRSGKHGALTGAHAIVHGGRKYWKSQIKVRGKVIYLGSFSTMRAAARAYKVASKKYHKSFSLSR